MAYALRFFFPRLTRSGVQVTAVYLEKNNFRPDIRPGSFKKNLGFVPVCFQSFLKNCPDVCQSSPTIVWGPQEL